jgi:hypothetical protein
MFTTTVKKVTTKKLVCNFKRLKYQVCVFIMGRDTQKRSELKKIYAVLMPHLHQSPLPNLGSLARWT